MCQVKYKKFFNSQRSCVSVGFPIFMGVFDIERPFSVTLCYGFVPDFAEKEHFCPYYSARYQPSQAGVPADFDPNCLTPWIWGIPQVPLAKGCHSLYRFGVQSRRSRFLRKYHYHLQIIAPGNAGFRLPHCLIAISPDSKDAYDPIGVSCDLLVWIVTATSCFGSLQMFV